MQQTFLIQLKKGFLSFVFLLVLSVVDFWPEIWPGSFQTPVWLWVSDKRWKCWPAHECFCLVQVTASRANRFQWRMPTGWTRRTGRTASTSTSAIASPSTAPSPIFGIPSKSWDKWARIPTFNSVWLDYMMRFSDQTTKQKNKTKVILRRNGHNIASSESWSAEKILWFLIEVAPNESKSSLYAWAFSSE